MRRQSGESRIFGPVDPYCVPPVAALAGVAVTLALTGTVGIGIAAALLALLIVMFDSWANRHESAVSHRVERNGHVRREWYERRLG